VAASVEKTLRRLAEQLIESTGGTGLVERMAHHAVPGLGLAVIANGEIASEGSYGVKEVGRPGPVTATTRFQACSISKPVAVLGMLRLVERGLLDLDADVNDLLTSWRVPSNAAWQPRVTLRQIASHSGGLTVSGFPGYSAGEPLPTLTQILTGSAPANTPGVRVDTFPGVQFRYAGGGTTVLQQVLEDATGQPFRELMRDLVLGPLGMSSSDYAQPLPLELHREAATAHRSDGTPVPGGWHVYPELAAAGLWTTPGDLARYAIAVQRSYHGAPDAVLGVELARQMLTPQIDSTPRMGGLELLGLGLFLGGRPEPRTFGHSGGNEGFKCHLLAHRDAGWGAVVMTNGDRGQALVQEILNALGRELEWPDYEAAEPPADIESGTALDAFTGVYELRPDAMIAVSRQGDDLCVRAIGQPEIRFVRVSETEFGSFGVGATLRFTRTADQDVTELILCQNGDELTCRRIGD
jgi:CubicO group peptidase (beta-lactamase class C family)